MMRYQLVGHSGGSESFAHVLSSETYCKLVRAAQWLGEFACSIVASYSLSFSHVDHC